MEEKNEGIREAEDLCFEPAPFLYTMATLDAIVATTDFTVEINQKSLSAHLSTREEEYDEEITRSSNRIQFICFFV